MVSRFRFIVKQNMTLISVTIFSFAYFYISLYRSSVLIALQSENCGSLVSSRKNHMNHGHDIDLQYRRMIKIDRNINRWSRKRERDGGSQWQRHRTVRHTIDLRWVKWSNDSPLKSKQNENDVQKMGIN